ncbi:DUF397 domain-containing protein [Streptomyces xinghaiensis]|uniref:DUF397 domain-containing protein n=1 Tax=Streptomyces xinghaiensis TaxID=1038928 RepID=UPI00379195F0
MPETIWVRSSHSEVAGNACVEVAAAYDSDVAAIRDSKSPETVIYVKRNALAEFISSVAHRTLQTPPATSR